MMNIIEQRKKRLTCSETNDKKEKKKRRALTFANRIEFVKTVSQLS